MKKASLQIVVLWCVSFALCGCTAMLAYQDGRRLSADGKTEEALTRFEEAAKLDNTSAQNRMAARTTGEALDREVEQRFLSAVEAGRLAEARALYTAHLTKRPNQDRLLARLQRLEKDARHREWIDAARAALHENAYATSRSWTRKVLSEDPKNPDAVLLQIELDRLEEKNAGSSEARLAEAFRKPISIDFKDAPLKAVFEVISRTAGVNFLFDREVKTDQKTSIFLRNASIEAAVRLTLLTNQLEQRVLDGNTVVIYPNTQAKQREYLPMAVRAFYLTSAEAKTVATSLKTILKARDVVVDDKLNMIIIRDSADVIRMAEKLVALHDVDEPEVMLEVEILEVKRSSLLNLGVLWPDQLTLTPLPLLEGGDGMVLSDLRSIKKSNLDVAIGPVTVNAKKLDSDANILANPRIRARNREKAKILIGERVPNITTTSATTGFVAESINYVDVGLKLDVEPTIYPDGEVAIKIALEVSNIVSQLQTKSGSVAYQIGTRTAQTVLRLKDGENQILAGLINDEDRSTANKLPGLGELPIVGRLFGSHADEGSKTEIVLSITPRVVRNLQRPRANLLEFQVGTEASVGASELPRVNPRAEAPAPAAPSAPETAAAGQGSGGTAGAAGMAAVSPASAGASPQSFSTTVAAAPAGTARQSSGDASTATNANTAGGAASQTVMRWVGPDQSKLGDTLSMQLLMQTSRDLVSLPMAVAFDPTVLQVLSVVEGDFLKQNGAQTSFSNRVDPGGQVLLTGTRAGSTGASGSGIVATVQFRVIATGSGQTPVRLITAAPITLGGGAAAVQMPAAHVIQLLR